MSGGMKLDFEQELEPCPKCRAGKRLGLGKEIAVGPDGKRLQMRTQCGSCGYFREPEELSLLETARACAVFLSYAAAKVDSP